MILTIRKLLGIQHLEILKTISDSHTIIQLTEYVSQDVWQIPQTVRVRTKQS